MQRLVKLWDKINKHIRKLLNLDYYQDQKSWQREFYREF